MLKYDYIFFIYPYKPKLVEETCYESRRTSKFKTTVRYNNGVIYVGSSLNLRNALFSVHKLWLLSKLINGILLVSKFKMIGMLLNVVYGQVQKS